MPSILIVNPSSLRIRSFGLGLIYPYFPYFGRHLYSYFKLIIGDETF